METRSTNSPRSAEPALAIKIGSPQECWKTLAALIEKRASAIYQRRAGTAEQGTELWKLAESQVEKPLCCGILKLTGGWRISFSAAEVGTTEIEICAEPHRLVLFGRNPPIGGTGISDPVVRVLRLPGTVNPGSLTVRQQGPILDIEVQAAVPDNERGAALQAA